MPDNTIPGRLYDQAQSRPNAPAYYVKKGSNWVPTNWETYYTNVRQVAGALLHLGVEAGQVVCILGNNRPEWVETDLAAMAIGAIPAGIYQTCSPEEIQYILSHSETPIVLVENEAQWKKVASVRDQLPHLKHIITMAGTKVDDEGTLDWEDFCARGVAGRVEVEGRLHKLDPKANATFIYTSGTTGPPKAVMLSHENLAWTATLAVGLVGMGDSDVALSYLPLSHIAEQMFSIHAPITSGGRVYFAESVEKMPDNLKEVQPTVFFGVPRVWEKFHAGVNAKLKLATGIKKHLVNFARNTGRTVSAKKNAGKPISGLLALKYKLATKLIFSKLKPALGLGNARVCVSGAAPIAPDVLEFMSTLDVVILEVYGQSEDTGPTTFNLPGATKYGTVGRRLEGVEVEIADDGEILVRGPNVFQGYYKDEAATQATLDDEGWLHSGDLGEFDADGYLVITGRKKDIIITAGGKNIAPKNIEAALMEHELVSQAVVIGDRRKFLSALVTLDGEAAERMIGSTDTAGHPEVKKALDAHVEFINSRFARVEHIRKFTVLPRELDQENGELTPTLKIKRASVQENWAETIDGMYA